MYRLLKAVILECVKNYPLYRYISCGWLHRWLGMTRFYLCATIVLQV